MFDKNIYGLGEIDMYCSDIFCIAVIFISVWDVYECTETFYLGVVNFSGRPNIAVLKIMLVY